MGCPSGPLDSSNAVQLADAKFSEEFAAFLLEKSRLDGQALERARRAAATTGDRIDRVLTKLGLLSDTDLALSLERFMA
jgi:general secretion pathway protein E